MSKMFPHSDTARLTIDLAAVQANYRHLCATTNPIPAAIQAATTAVQVGACVKANAYGLGLKPVVQALARAGCRRFYVATTAEGVAARQALQDCAPPPVPPTTSPTAPDAAPPATIVVLHGFQADEAATILAARLTPVLNSRQQVIDFAALCQQAAPDSTNAIIHIDTGMNRLGLAAQDLAALCQGADFRALPIDGVMSHLACADLPDHPMNAKQRDGLAAIPLWRDWQHKSLANSSGIFLGAGYHFDQVRPGMALYGLNPTPAAANPMRMVVTLTAPILQVRSVSGLGLSVGYHATPIPAGVTRLATLGIGYADGVPWRPTSHSVCYIDDVPCPVVGRVSMDLTVIDVSAVPESLLATAGEATVLGAHYDAESLARDTGTIGYSVLTGLGGRLQRHYSDDV
jgi:alanine racemase